MYEMSSLVKMKLPACFEGSNTQLSRLMITTCCDMLALIVMSDDDCGFALWLMKQYGNEDS